MGVAVGVARPDHGQLVGMRANEGKVIGHGQAAGAARAERPEFGSEEADFPAPRIDEFLVLGHFRAREPGEGGLGIEGVHLARSAVHHEEDAGLGLAGMMRPPRGEGPVRAGLPAEHSGQGDSREAATHFPQEFAAGQSAWKQTIHASTSIHMDELVGVEQDMA